MSDRPGLGLELDEDALRHFAYAIQWWCFAALALVIWAVLGVRRARRGGTR